MIIILIIAIAELSAEYADKGGYTSWRKQAKTSRELVGVKLESQDFTVVWESMSFTPLDIMREVN